MKQENEMKKSLLGLPHIYSATYCHRLDQSKPPMQAKLFLPALTHAKRD